MKNLQIYTPVAKTVGDRGFFAKLRSRNLQRGLAQATGDCPPLYKQKAPLEGSFVVRKFQKKGREIRRSEAAKSCRIVDLRSAGNYLLLIYEINYVLDYYIDVLLSIFSIFD